MKHVLFDEVTIIEHSGSDVMSREAHVQVASDLWALKNVGTENDEQTVLYL